MSANGDHYDVKHAAAHLPLTTGAEIKFTRAAKAPVVTRIKEINFSKVAEVANLSKASVIADRIKLFFACIFVLPAAYLIGKAIIKGWHKPESAFKELGGVITVGGLPYYKDDIKLAALRHELAIAPLPITSWNAPKVPGDFSSEKLYLLKDMLRKEGVTNDRMESELNKYTDLSVNSEEYKKLVNYIKETEKDLEILNYEGYQGLQADEIATRVDNVANRAFKTHDDLFTEIAKLSGSQFTLKDPVPQLSAFENNVEKFLSDPRNEIEREHFDAVKALEKAKYELAQVKNADVTLTPDQRKRYKELFETLEGYQEQRQNNDVPDKKGVEDFIREIGEFQTELGIAQKKDPLEERYLNALHRMNSMEDYVETAANFSWKKEQEGRVKNLREEFQQIETDMQFHRLNLALQERKQVAEKRDLVLTPVAAKKIQISAEKAAVSGSTAQQIEILKRDIGNLANNFKEIDEITDLNETHVFDQMIARGVIRDNFLFGNMMDDIKAERFFDAIPNSKAEAYKAYDRALAQYGDKYVSNFARRYKNKPKLDPKEAVGTYFAKLESLKACTKEAVLRTLRTKFYDLYKDSNLVFCRENGNIVLKKRGWWEPNAISAEEARDFAIKYLNDPSRAPAFKIATTEPFGANEKDRIMQLACYGTIVDSDNELLKDFRYDRAIKEFFDEAPFEKPNEFLSKLSLEDRVKKYSDDPIEFYRVGGVLKAYNGKELEEIRKSDAKQKKVTNKMLAYKTPLEYEEVKKGIKVILEQERRAKPLEPKAEAIYFDSNYQEFLTRAYCYLRDGYSDLANDFDNSDNLSLIQQLEARLIEGH